MTIERLEHPLPNWLYYFLREHFCALPEIDRQRWLALSKEYGRQDAVWVAAFKSRGNRPELHCQGTIGVLGTQLVGFVCPPLRRSLAQSLIQSALEISGPRSFALIQPRWFRFFKTVCRNLRSPIEQTERTHWMGLDVIRLELLYRPPHPF